MVKAVLLITTAATLLLAVSGLEQRDAIEVKDLEAGRKFYKGKPEEREMRDKLLNLVHNDGEAAFDMLNDLRGDMGKSSIRIQKRDNLIEPGHRIFKDKKEDREMRDKLLEFVKKDEDEAFRLLNELREDRADLSKYTSPLEKRDNLIEPGHKILKDKKEDREMRDKLLEFVKKDEDEAFRLLNDLREDRADLSKYTAPLEKRDNLIEPGHKILKGKKEEREMRDKLLEFVKKDEDEAFRLLNDLREDRADLSKYTAPLEKRDSLIEPGHKILKDKKEDREMRDKLLEFVKKDEDEAFRLLNDLREDRADLSKYTASHRK